MATLKFYEIDAAYINYLQGTDKKVPRVDYSAVSKHDKFLCGIVLSINGHDYFAPISSFKTPQRTNMLIKNEQGRVLSSIRFSFMIPVPPGAAKLKDIPSEPSVQYRRLLNWELRYCNKHASAIMSRAKFVYDAVVNKKDPIVVRNCCNFKALEIACSEYLAQSRSVTDVGEKDIIVKSDDGVVSVLETIRSARMKKREHILPESKEPKTKNGSER